MTAEIIRIGFPKQPKDPVLFDEYCRAKAAWSSVPMMREVGLSDALADEIEVALFERCARLLNQLVKGPA